MPRQNYTCSCCDETIGFVKGKQEPLGPRKPRGWKVTRSYCLCPDCLGHMRKGGWLDRSSHEAKKAWQAGGEGMTKILFRCDCCGYSITTMPASFRWEKSEQYWLCPNCTSHITRVTGVLELDRSSHGYKDLYDETKKAWQAGVSDGQERVKRPLLVMPRPVRTVMASGLMFGASGLMFSGEPSGNGFFQVTESPEEQKLEANKFVPPPGKTELGRKLRMEGK